MKIWPNLGNPVPKEQPGLWQPILWPQGNQLQLDSLAPPLPCKEEVDQFLRSRRTERQFGPISDEILGGWLDLGCRAQLVSTSAYGFDISWRPTPSAGAIHPIHLIFAVPGQSTWRRYDAVEHVLIDMPSKLDAREVVQAMQEVLPAAHATLVLYAAEVGKTAAKYDSPASLIWRDAGALLAVMGLAAYAHSLAFCPLGVTGEPWVGRLLKQQGLFGVGAAFIGTRPAPG